MTAAAIDIKAKAAFPAGALSNFAAHPFQLDGVACGGMEGFLQGLKTNDHTAQLEICALTGEAAQKAGRQYAWKHAGVLWWRGEAFDRLSEDYQQLLDRAYAALAEQSQAFKRALLATGDSTLTHSIGQTDPCETILTADEFCMRLMALRARLRGG
ncbi:MAG: hypothetical protein ABIO39_13415 [Caulobacteraceae bacterium]